jgi:glycosyltransferase involved in cell wall biosynthesis
MEVSMSVQISVIVPVYNAEQYLKKCVSSISNQTMKNIEVILVNDGSTDESGKLCDEFAASDSRVKVIHKTNEGASSARNTGMAAALGEYIGFVDADDWIEQDMYEVMFSNAKEYDSDAVFCNYIAESSASTQTVNVNSGGQQIYNKQEIKEKIFPCFFGYKYSELSNYKNYCTFTNYNSYIWLCIYKRAIIKKAGITFPSERIYFNEDNLFNLSFIYNAKIITHMDKYFYHYRYNESSLTKIFNDKYFKNKLNKYDYLLSFINNYNLEKSYRDRLGIKICIETINLINYYVNSKSLSFKDKYKNIRLIINTPLISKALNDFNIKQLSLSQMRVFLYFAKKRAYLMLMMLSIGYGALNKIK